MRSVVSAFVVGCDFKQDGLTKVKVNEVTHSIFYAPFYVAINNDYFADDQGYEFDKREFS